MCVPPKCAVAAKGRLLFPPAKQSKLPSKQSKLVSAGEERGLRSGIGSFSYLKHTRAHTHKAAKPPDALHKLRLSIPAVRSWQRQQRRAVCVGPRGENSALAAARQDRASTRDGEAFRCAALPCSPTCSRLSWEAALRLLGGPSSGWLRARLRSAFLATAAALEGTLHNDADSLSAASGLAPVFFFNIINFAAPVVMKVGSRSTRLVQYGTGLDQQARSPTATWVCSCAH